MILQTMRQMKEAFAKGDYKSKVARVLWDDELQGYILDIDEADLKLSTNIITAATTRSPYNIKSFKSIDGAVAHLKEVGFTECTLHIG